jgi:putative sterol carrier protein
MPQSTSGVREIKDILEQLRNNVIERMNKDEKFRSKLEKIDKKFSVDFDGSIFYHFSISNGHISEIMDGKEDGDISISVESEVFRKILAKELDPMEAYFEKKIRVKASLLDKLFLTELFK